MTDSKIYAKRLFPTGNGYPLFNPDPLNDVPDRDRKIGIRIGDVGVVTRDGSFDTIFNITLASNDPSNRFGVPAGYVQVTLRPGDIAERAQCHPPGSDISNTAVKKTRLDMDAGTANNVFSPLEANAVVEVSMNSKQTAVLLLPEGASSLDLRGLQAFRDYALKHAESWYAFVNGDLGRMIGKGDLYLVTGVTKSTSWSVAALENHSGDGKVSMRLKAAQFGGAGTSYTWEWEGSYRSVNSGPRRNPGEETWGANQTVFLRGFKVASRSILLRRPVKVFPIVDSKWSEIKPGNKFVPFSQPNFATSPPNGLPQNVPSTSDNAHAAHEIDYANLYQPTCVTNEHLFDCVPGVTLTDEAFDDADDDKSTASSDSLDYVPNLYHPSCIINDHLFDCAPDATVAVTHDDEWASILDEADDEVPERSELIRRMSNKFNIQTSSGGVYLQRRNTDNSASSSTDQKISWNVQAMNDDDLCTQSPQCSSPEAGSLPFEAGIRTELDLSGPEFYDVDSMVQPESPDFFDLNRSSPAPSSSKHHRVPEWILSIDACETPSEDDVEAISPNLTSNTAYLGVEKSEDGTQTSADPVMLNGELNDPSNRFGVPAGYEQVTLRPGDIARQAHCHLSGSDISNTTVKKKRVDVDAGIASNVFLLLDANAVVEVSMNSKKTAVLCLPQGASSLDLRGLQAFRDNALKHAESWYAFVNGDLGRMIGRGDLYLNTVVTMSTPWNVAAVENHSGDEQVSMRFKAVQIGAAGTSHTWEWEEGSNRSFNSGPRRNSGEETWGANQTVLLSGYKLARRSSLLPPVKLSPIVDSKWFEIMPRSKFVPVSRPNFATSPPNGLLQNASSTSNNANAAHEKYSLDYAPNIPGATVTDIWLNLLLDESEAEGYPTACDTGPLDPVTALLEKGAEVNLPDPAHGGAWRTPVVVVKPIIRPKLPPHTPTHLLNMDTLEIFARFEAERSAATLTSAKVMEFVELIVHTMGGTVPSTSIDPTAPRRARYAAPFLLHRPPKASDPCTTSDRRPGNHRGRSGDMTRLHSTPTYLHDLDLLYTPILREFDAAGRPRWMAPCVGEAGGIEPLDSLYAHIRDSGPPFDAAGHSRFMIPCVGEAGGVGDLDLAVGPFHRCTARRRRRTIRLLSAEDHVPRSPHIRSLGSPDNGGCPDSEDGDSDAK